MNDLEKRVIETASNVFQGEMPDFVKKALSDSCKEQDLKSDVLVAATEMANISNNLKLVSDALNRLHVDIQFENMTMKMDLDSKPKADLLFKLAAEIARQEMSVLSGNQDAESQCRQNIGELVDTYESIGGVILRYIVIVNDQDTSSSVSELANYLKKANIEHMPDHLQVDVSDNCVKCFVSATFKQTVVDSLFDYGVHMMEVCRNEQPFVGCMRSYVNAVEVLAEPNKVLETA